MKAHKGKNTVLDEVCSDCTFACFSVQELCRMITLNKEQKTQIPVEKGSHNLNFHGSALTSHSAVIVSMNVHIVITVFNGHFKAMSIPQTGEIKDTQHSLINTNICFSSPMVSGNLVLSLCRRSQFYSNTAITAPTRHTVNL